MCKKLLVLLMLIICTNAYAGAEDETDFSDWKKVTNLLTLKGINVNNMYSKIQMDQVRAVCSTTNVLSDAATSNKCFTVKLLNKTNISLIRIIVKPIVNKSISNLSTTITKTVIKNDKNQEISAIKESTALLTETEVKEFKDSSYVTCMHESGWNNPNAWVDGRRVGK